MDSTGYRAQYRGTALFIFLHVAVLFICFSVLGVVFEFPEVLRQPAQYRLGLFRANQGIILPVYWLLALSGFSQIAISVFL